MRAEHDPDGRCWTYLDRTWTWAEAWDDARRFAGALQAEGIVRGDRIAFLDKNNPAILTATQAVCLLGEDFQEGYAAFRDKRAADFIGRPGAKR